MMKKRTLFLLMINFIFLSVNNCFYGMKYNTEEQLSLSQIYHHMSMCLKSKIIKDTGLIPTYIERAKKLLRDKEVSFNKHVLNSFLCLLCCHGKYCDLELVQLLINAGADVNVHNTVMFSCDTPLSLACRYGNSELAQVLLQTKKIDFSPREDSKPECLFHEIVNDYLAAINYQEISRTSSEFDCFLLLDLLLKHSDCSARRDDTGTLLHYAVLHWYEFNGIIPFLLSCGVKPRLTNKDGKTALHLIAQYMHRMSESVSAREKIASLLQYGADINAIDDYGNMPLHAAMHRGCDCWNEEFFYNISYLLLCNADATSKNKKGKTPLHLFTENCLIPVGAMQDYEHYYKLACMYPSKIIGRLVVYGAYVNEQDAKGCTPLHYVAKYGQIECLPMLMCAGADPFISDIHKKKPIDYVEEGTRIGRFFEYVIHNQPMKTLFSPDFLTTELGKQYSQMSSSLLLDMFEEKNKKKISAYMRDRQIGLK